MFYKLQYIETQLCATNSDNHYWEELRRRENVGCRQAKVANVSIYVVQ
jgi:hypothetical protein